MDKQHMRKKKQHCQLYLEQAFATSVVQLRTAKFGSGLRA
jgi:hypothetical protein